MSFLNRFGFLIVILLDVVFWVGVVYLLKYIFWH